MVVRKVAYLDCGGWRWSNCGQVSSLLAWKQGIVRLLFKGWQVVTGVDMSIYPISADNYPPELLTELRPFITAQILCELRKERASEPFAEVRTKNGFSVTIPENLQSVAERLMDLSPPGWSEMNFSTLSVDEITALALKYPKFSPLWWLLRTYDDSATSISRHEILSKYDDAKVYVAGL